MQLIPRSGTACDTINVYSYYIYLSSDRAYLPPLNITSVIKQENPVYGLSLSLERSKSELSLLESSIDVQCRLCTWLAVVPHIPFILLERVLCSMIQQHRYRLCSTETVV